MTPARRGNGVQPLKAGRVGALSMQHQVLVRRRQAARHRRANSGAAPSND
jgi:hypothetical protein